MRVLLAALCVAVSVVDPAVNSTLASSPDTLRILESEFITVDRSAHPGFVQLEGDWVEARAAAAQARAFPNPRLEYLREAYEGNRSTSTLLLNWVWPWDGRRGLRTAAADQAAGAAAERLSAERLSARTYLREIYAEWAQQGERGVLYAEVHDRIERLADQQRARAAAGEASRLDARRLELASTEVGVQRALAEAARVSAEARAAAWRPELFEPGHPTRTVRPLRPTLPPTPSPTALAETSEPALVRAARREVTRGELEARLARRSWESPELTAGAVTDRADDVSDGAVALGVAWALPILDRGGAQRVAKGASLHATRARLDRLERDAESARAAALVNYTTLRAAAETASSATEGLLSTIEAAAESYRFGESSLTDLLGTLQLVLSSGTAAIELR